MNPRTARRSAGLQSEAKESEVAAGDIVPVPGGREGYRAGTIEPAIPDAAVRVVLPVVLGASAGAKRALARLR